MKKLILAALLALPAPSFAAEAEKIEAIITGLATAADAQDWARLDVKFADHVMVNQLSLASTEGARVTEQAVVEAWAQLLPRFDTTRHDVSEIEVLAVSSITAKATARYSATYQLNGETWQQTGRLEYLLKNTTDGWQVTALNTSPEWENQPLSTLFDTSSQCNA